MVSRGIIPFEEHIAAVGTTSNNKFSKRKALDDHRFTSTPYVPMNPGIGPLFFQLTVCANSVGVCVHQMNKYLPHAYILKRTKSNKEFIFTRT